LTVFLQICTIVNNILFFKQIQISWTQIKYSATFTNLRELAT